VLGPIPILNLLVEGTPIGQDLLTGGVGVGHHDSANDPFPFTGNYQECSPASERRDACPGGNQWEVLSKAVLPFARGGIVGAAMLGLARAIGETMAVTMVIGNSSTQISPSLLTPGYTIASVIANQFVEADTDLYFSAIVELGLILFVGFIGF